MAWEIKASIQKEAGSYPAPEIFRFDTWEEYQQWIVRHNTNHWSGKIIGIHSEIEY